MLCGPDDRDPGVSPGVMMAIDDVGVRVFIAIPNIGRSCTCVNTVTCIAAGFSRSWRPARPVGPGGQALGAKVKGVWGRCGSCTPYVHTAYRTGVGRAFEAHVRCAKGRESCTESGWTHWRRQQADGRWRPPVAGKCPSPDFPAHIRPATDALENGQGVCAHNSGRNPPLAPLAFCSDNRWQRAGQKVQEPLDFSAVLADTTCGIRRNPLSKETLRSRHGGKSAAGGSR